MERSGANILGRLKMFRFVIVNNGITMSNVPLLIFECLIRKTFGDIYFIQSGKQRPQTHQQKESECIVAELLR